jgi:hypothetical protein
MLSIGVFHNECFAHYIVFIIQQYTKPSVDHDLKEPCMVQQAQLMLLLVKLKFLQMPIGLVRLFQLICI